MRELPVSAQSLSPSIDVILKGIAECQSITSLERVYDLRRNPIVRDIRGYGLLAGVELAPAEAFGQRGYAALQRIHAAGVVVRVTADTVILAPALIAEREQIDRICDTLGDVLSAL